MKILQLEGTAPQLFTLVGPLVMNPKVLRANHNFPYRTAENFRWFVATEGEEVIGFLPLEARGRHLKVNNYYVRNDDADVLTELLNAVISQTVISPQEDGLQEETPRKKASREKDSRKTLPPYDLNAIVLVRHESVFAQCGFQVEHRWVKYVKMTYTRIMG